MTHPRRQTAVAAMARRVLPWLALLAASGAQAQLNPCNYLVSYPSGFYLTLIGNGTTIIDGGYADGFTRDWCSLGHLTVQSGGALYNGRVASPYGNGTTEFRNGFVTVLPDGIFPSDTVLTNHGTVENGAFGVFINSAPLVNDGVLNNRGAMTGSETRQFVVPSYNGSISNLGGGVFNNSGSLTFAAADAYYTALSNTGTINNSGLIANGGNVLNDAAGVFNNTGTLRNGGSVLNAATATFNNNGAFINLAGASVSIDARGVFNNGSAGPASIVNQGSLQLAGTLNNRAGLRNEGSFDVLDGATVNNLAGINTGFDNQGTLTNAGTLAVAVGTLVQNGGQLYNLAGISGAGGLRNAVDALVENRGTIDIGSLVNDGALSTFTAITVRGGFDNSGFLTNYFGPVRVDGPVVNDGPRFDPDGNLISLPRMDLYGSFQARGDLYNGAYGQINVLGGRLDVDGSLRNDGYLLNSGQTWLNGPAAAMQSQGSYIQAGPPSALTVVNGTYWGSIRIDSGTLSGTGTIRGAVGVNGGVLAPGPYNGLTIQNPMVAGPAAKAARLAAAAATATATGTLTIDGDLYFNDGTLLLGIAGTLADSFDVLHVTGHASFAGGTVKLTFLDGFLPTLGDHWLLLLADAGTDGLATLTAAYSGLAGGYGFSVQLTDAGLDVQVSSVAAVPEPAAALLLAAGMPCLLALAMRRRRRAGADRATGGLAPGRRAGRQRLVTAP